LPKILQTFSIPPVAEKTLKVRKSILLLMIPMPHYCQRHHLRPMKVSIVETFIILLAFIIAMHHDISNKTDVLHPIWK
jgi:hypothetical protein